MSIRICSLCKLVGHNRRTCARKTKTIPTDTTFKMRRYFDKLDEKIIETLRRPCGVTITYDILDTPTTSRYKEIVLKEKQRQMKIGEIMQFAFGNYDLFEDLNIGHPTGLDVISKERKIIIELKNRTNTDNHSSKKTNLSKLAKFKKEHPEYECIYGCINSNTEERTVNGEIKTIYYNGVEIKQYVGVALLRHVFGDQYMDIITHIKNRIDEELSRL